MELDNKSSSGRQIDYQTQPSSGKIHAQGIPIYDTET